MTGRKLRFIPSFSSYGKFNSKHQIHGYKMGNMSTHLCFKVPCFVSSKYLHFPITLLLLYQKNHNIWVFFFFGFRLSLFIEKKHRLLNTQGSSGSSKIVLFSYGLKMLFISLSNVLPKMKKIILHFYELLKICQHKNEL